MSGSRINDIVDYTAARAAGIAGVKAVFGSGSSGLDDPLRPGNAIRPIDAAPTQPFEHWSELPDAPGFEWNSQQGDVVFTWTLEMRLWLEMASLADLRRRALPYYDLYARAFITDRLLGGLVKRIRLARFALLTDPPVQNKPRWAWLQINLEAIENVRYP